MESISYENITELNVGSNRFAGTIPSAYFDGRKMEVFDVSNNLLTGTFDLNITPSNASAEMAANVNRLSGPLDTASLEQYEQPDVLTGNVFSCSTLVENDVGRQTYVCGSQDFNISIYTSYQILLSVNSIVDGISRDIFLKSKFVYWWKNC